MMYYLAIILSITNVVVIVLWYQAERDLREIIRMWKEAERRYLDDMIKLGQR